MASYIPAGQPPSALWQLPWHWEDNADASPILGVPMAQSIVQARIVTILIHKVESRIARYQTLALSFAARLMVANCIILGCI